MIGGGPYRQQPVAASAPPSRRGLWLRRVGLVALVLATSWCFGGCFHLPWRTRALCGWSADVGESFSPRAFRRRARLLALNRGGERAETEHVRESWALGTWIFLRCSCGVFHRNGRVVQKRLVCFD
ncbi:MAG: hypothetical protein U0325_21045 [Polyangiales bacterium]